MKKQLLKLSAVLSAMFLFAGIASAQHEAPIRATEIPHIKWTGTAWETITIDGMANETSYGAQQTITEYWTPAPPIPLPARDLGGFIQLCYDANNIYLFATITDDTACIFQTGAKSQWEFDNIEVFFDLDTTINLVSNLGDFNDTSGAPDATQFRWNRGVADSTTGNAARNGADLANFSETDNGTQWTIEVAIPFLSWMPEGSVIEDLNAWVEKAMGFDVSIADSDADNVAGARTGQMAWDADTEGSGGTEDNAWHDTRVFGVMTLGAVPVATSTAASEGINLYPNPVQNVLNITNLNNVVNVNIVNTLGQVVESVEVNSSNVQIDLSDLASGLYVVVMNKANGDVITSNIVR